MVEHVGQSHENQCGAAVHIHAVGKAGGEDDEARAQSHHGIQQADPDGFAHEGVVFADVAAENRHGADAETQGEEGLIHGAYDHITHPDVRHSLKIRDQVEGQTLGAAGQGHAVEGKYPHEKNQGHHHPLGDTFQTLLDAKRYDGEAEHHNDAHIECHFAGGRQHFPKFCFNSGGVQPCVYASGGVHKILEHPAGYGGVEHHQHDIAQQAHIAVPAPFASGLQLPIHFQGAFLSGPAHGKFHGQHRNAQRQKKQKIDQHKRTAAVLPGHPWEFPDVADADGTACAEEEEAQPASQMLTLHCRTSNDEYL